MEKSSNMALATYLQQIQMKIKKNQGHLKRDKKKINAVCKKLPTTLSGIGKLALNYHTLPGNFMSQFGWALQ